MYKIKYRQSCRILLLAIADFCMLIIKYIYILFVHVLAEHPVDCLLSDKSQGYEYNGKVNKTVDGTDCIHWKDAVRHYVWVLQICVEKPAASRGLV